MLKENTFWGVEDKVEIAIERIKQFCPPEGYWLAFSGGKDSLVIKALADMAGVNYEAHFSLTTVDPPEVIRYTRQYHPDVSLDRPPKSMWQIIVERRIPPIYKYRYCCEELKEHGGIGYTVLTGIRWQESWRRRKRKMVETCNKYSNKFYIHPIIDWSEDDVWSFIRQHNLPYCTLYNEGFTRIGCVMCPLKSHKQRVQDVKRFPNFYKAYMRAFQKMLEVRNQNGLETHGWDTAEDVMTWWLREPYNKSDANQMELFSMYE